jgi:hypothetical protein
MKRAFSIAAAAAAILAVFGSQYAWVRARNFGGWDEWLVIDLTYRGIVGLPYQNRPFSLVLTLPASLLSPHGLWGFSLLHGAYLAGSGFLLYLIVRRLAPEQERLALLAGILGPCFSPMDDIRLDVVLTASYAGVTFAGLLALLLLIESYRLRSVPILIAVAILGGLVTRCVEAAAGLMLAGPLLLLALPEVEGPSWRRWAMGWTTAIGMATALVAGPILVPPPGGSYQTQGLGFDPHPVRVALRVLRQFGFHLLPLVTPVWSEVATFGALISGAVFLGVWAITSSIAAHRDDDPQGTLRLGVIGLAGAALGYGVLALSPAITGPARAEILSAPGIGLFLSAAIFWIASRTGRGSRLLVTLLGAWIVVLGTARVVAMQRQWDVVGYWTAQRETLASLVSAAPDFTPDTFVLLLDGTAAFPATFTFHHALDYLYERRAAGISLGAEAFLYPHFFSKDGLLSLPLESIRGPWHEPARLYRYEQLVVVRATPTRGISVLDEWPDGPLPPLPPGATYRPRERIRASPPRPELEILAAK